MVRKTNNADKSSGIESNLLIEELFLSADTVADDLAWSLQSYLEATTAQSCKNPKQDANATRASAPKVVEVATPSIRAHSNRKSQKH